VSHVLGSCGQGFLPLVSVFGSPVLLQVPPGWEGAWAGVARDLRLVLSVLANTRVLLQVRLAGKAETAGCAMEVSLSLVVHRASVILERALVAEGRRALEQRFSYDKVAFQAQLLLATYGQ